MHKRVLLVCGSEMCKAGVPRVIMTIVRGLKDKYIFDILCLSDKAGKYDQEFCSYGGNIYKITLSDYSKNKILYIFRGYYIAKEMKKILRNVKYDVIHCHCGIDAGVCLLIAEKKGISVRICHAHGTYKRKGKNYLLRMYNRIQKRLIKECATKCLACSDIAGKTLFSKRKYVNVLNPVNIEYYRNIEKYKHEGIHLLQIGYYCENKNQMFSLKILKELKRRGQVCEMHFIGFPSEPAYYDKIKQYVVDNDLQNDTVFLTADEDKRKEFSWADYSLVPSDSEGLPLVALEAQSSKTICLMSNHVPVDANIGYGIFLEYNNINVWVEAILKLSSTKKNNCQIVKDVSNDSFLRKMEDAYERS